MRIHPSIINGVVENWKRQLQDGLENEMNMGTLREGGSVTIRTVVDGKRLDPPEEKDLIFKVEVKMQSP